MEVLRGEIVDPGSAPLLEASVSRFIVFHRPDGSHADDVAMHNRHTLYRDILAVSVSIGFVLSLEFPNLAPLLLKSWVVLASDLSILYRITSERRSHHTDVTDQ